MFFKLPFLRRQKSGATAGPPKLPAADKRKARHDAMAAHMEWMAADMHARQRQYQQLEQAAEQHSIVPQVPQYLERAHQCLNRQDGTQLSNSDLEKLLQALVATRQALEQEERAWRSMRILDSNRETNIRDLLRQLAMTQQLVEARMQTEKLTPIATFILPVSSTSKSFSVTYKLTPLPLP